MSKTKEVAIIINDKTLSTQEVALMRNTVGPLYGHFLYKVESTKLDDEDKSPEAERLFSVKRVLITHAEFISGKETRTGIATVIFNGDSNLTFALVDEPFQEIDEAKALRKDFEIGEGWYKDGEKLATIVRAMNEGTIAKYNSRINKFTELINVVETAISVDEAAVNSQKMLEEVLSA